MPSMIDRQPLQGELQSQLMHAVWALDGGTVEQIRSALPPAYQGAYTTVQTVLNRLAERGLLSRVKAGRGFEYVATLNEAEYVAQAIEGTLAGASVDARHAALINVIGRMDSGEISELQNLAREAERERSQ